nr:MAG TPA: hypothetical protein [Caudoviricetes sp.]
MDFDGFWENKGLFGFLWKMRSYLRFWGFYSFLQWYLIYGIH